MLGRELKPVLRDPFSVVFSMIQPLFFLALFAPLLSSVTGLGQGSSLQWFVPGIVVMSCLFGASMTGSNLLMEMQTGSHERTLVTPLSRSSLLLGRALKEIVPVVVQAVIVVAVVAPFSFEVHPVGIVVGLLMLSVFCVGLGSLSYALALATRGAGLDLLDRAADVPVPGAAARRHAAAGGRRPGLAAGAVEGQPADLHRRRDAQPVRGLVRRLAGGPGHAGRGWWSARSGSPSACGRCGPRTEPRRSPATGRPGRRAAAS